jgi:hypothetical protein
MEKTLAEGLDGGTSGDALNPAKWYCGKYCRSLFRTML